MLRFVSTRRPDWSAFLLPILGPLLIVVLPSLQACTGERVMGQDLPAEFALLINRNEPNSRFNFASTQMGSVPGPARFDVYFTQPGTNSTNGIDPILDDALVDLIGSAASKVDIAIFELERQNVVDALIAAKARGVTVRMVGDADNAGESGYTQLQGAGISMKNRPPGAQFMHHKFVVVDSRYLWTGSTNLTDGGILRNNNNALIIDNTTLAAAYTAEFNEMFTGMRFGNSKNDVLTSNSTTVNGVQVEYFMGPKEALMNQLLARIGTADVSIHFMVFAFTRDDVKDALLARRNAGVKVYGVFDQLQAGGPYAEDTALASGGVASWIDGNNNSNGQGGGILHHKVMVIDGNSGSDPMVITGSANWTEAADSDNDENMIIIHSADLARFYLQEFCAVVGVASVHPSYTGNTDSGCGGKSMINEVLANPDGSDTGNEYVEIVNTGIGSVNMGGWKLLVGGTERHTFVANYVLPPSGVSVVFDSGVHGGIAGATNSSTGSLNLVNSGATVELRNAQGTLMDTFTYNSATSGVSDNRNPDASPQGGIVVRHDQVTSANGSLSPGKRANQSAFPNVGASAGPSIPPPAPGELIVAAFSTRGSASAADEFVELYNNSDHPIEISGVALEYQSSSCGGWSNRATIASGVTLSAGQSYLLANSSGYSAPASGPAPDGTFSAGIADNGHLRLVSVAGGEVDRVAFGGGLACAGEGNTIAPNHGTSANAGSVARRPGAFTNAFPAQDTNNNAADFFVVSQRTPKNSSAPASPSYGPAVPAPGELIITQLATRGSASAYDEFVEIYNNSRKNLTIDGVSIQYMPSSCSSWSDRLTVGPGTTLAPGRFFLAANTRGYSVPGSGPTPDGLMSTSGFSDISLVRLLSATAVQLDLLNFSATDCPAEGAPGPDHASTPGGSIARFPLANGSNCSVGSPVVDTQNNANDFGIKSSRQPRNKSSAAQPSH